ncbi:helix-turn-helix domain-containing protein [Mycobacterium sp. 155]|uniref:helix-turn-helix domain-containing protein n=1 Tax=Mycobacterium sp. 155 TaxID=1157943 RepID=UPI00037E81EA|nr:helix-turn-helix domain-containing protein [Mycobacterium sp. 155]
MRKNQPAQQVSKRQLISTKQAAEQLNVSPNTVRALIANGRFAGYKGGRLVKVDANEVERYIDRIATK